MSANPQRTDQRFFAGTTAWAVALGVVMFAVFFASPVLYIHDSNYSMLVGEHLLTRGDLRLDEHFWPAVDSSGYPEVRKGHQLPRQVRPIQGHLYYWYPLGPSVFSVPLIAAMRTVLGESTIRQNGTFDPDVEARWQKRIAALLSALLCVVFFYTARLLLNTPASLAVALSAGLSSQVWSTVSRAVRTHTWSILLLSLALYLLLRAEERDESCRPVLLATLLSLAFFSRPTAACFIVPLALYVAWRRPRSFVWLAGTGGGWLLLFIGFNRTLFGSTLPPYFSLGGGITPMNLGTGLAGQLISPSRGLFVYVPLVLFVAWLLVRYRNRLPHRGLALASVASIVALALVVGMFRNWWGGSCYGARFYTDAVPSFVLLGILGVVAATRERRASGVGVRTRRWEAAFFAVAFTFGAVVNGAGAWSKSGKRWNSVPESIRANPARAFDWRRAQFIGALRPSLLEERNDEGDPDR